MRFDFTSPTRILFGAGTLREAGPTVRAHGSRALVVTGKNHARAQPLLARLQSTGVTASVFPTAGEPTLADVTAGVRAAKEGHCDVVIGLGGGSALDAAKAMAAMATNPGEVLDYLEVIGKGQPLTQPPLPFIAIPTTAGTGSEVTRNAVLGSPEHRVKVSLRSPLMSAKVAILDPELTLSLPPGVTATTGMDALTQCLEAYVSCKANPLTDAFCIEGLRRAARSLRRACMEGGDLTARTDMALASLYSGIALAHAGLGAVHGFAGPLGGMFPAPHGALCAALLPHVVEANLGALRNREPHNPTLGRFHEIAPWLMQDPSATIEDAVAWLKQLQSDLGIPRLGHWGIGPTHFPEILPKAAAASSMKGNPLKLEEAELQSILAAAI
jgi:alcohol dehydrogenase class IV